MILVQRKHLYPILMDNLLPLVKIDDTKVYYLNRHAGKIFIHIADDVIILRNVFEPLAVAKILETRE